MKNPPLSWQLHVAGAIIDLAKPLIQRKIRKRLTQGREIPERVNQRFGIATSPKPKGQLLWFHGASLGETNSLKPLINWYLAQSDQHNALVTSGSKSSTQQLTRSLPTRARHQLLPAEHGPWIQRFLDHWQPDALVIAEQEFWPRLLTKVAQNNVPTLVVNGRLSAKSFARWKRFSAIGLNAPALVQHVHTQDDIQRRRFEALGITQVKTMGNLKFADATPDSLRPEKPAGDWTILHAMSHTGEEEQAEIAKATRAAAGEDDENLRHLLCPRHVERLVQQNTQFKIALWSAGKRPSAETPVVHVDQYGVMQDVYAHASVCILGGTFSNRVGGHSPIEALRAGVPVIVGPQVWAQQSIMDSLIPSGAVTQVPDMSAAFDLAVALRNDPSSIKHQLSAFSDQQGQGAQALAAAQDWVAETLSL